MHESTINLNLTEIPQTMSEPIQIESILVEAARIIEGDREQTYGKFSKNLDNIATLWRQYFDMISDENGMFFLTGKDVCMMMVLLKIAREANKHKRDNLVDICGYTALAQKIEDSKESNAE